MKKIILSMLLAIMAGFAAFGFAACGDKTGDSSSTLQNGVEVSFPEVDGIVFVTDDLVNGQIEKGSTLTFTLDLSAWKGSKNFTLLAGDQPITPNEQGTYTVTVNEALTLRFADVTVSFNEAEGVYWAKDQFSSNGTYINGRFARGETEIKSNDVIVIGKTKLIFLAIPDF